MWEEEEKMRRRKATIKKGEIDIVKTRQRRDTREDEGRIEKE